MRKFNYVILGLFICSLFIGCANSEVLNDKDKHIQITNTLESQEKLWSPHIEELKWGMTSDEVVKTLNCEGCEVAELDGYEGFYSITPKRKYEIYGIEAECVIFLEEIESEILLSRIRFQINDSDIATLQ